jgi:hypothetical protein
VRRLASLVSAVAVAVTLVGPAQADVAGLEKSGSHKLIGFSTGGSLAPVERLATGGGCRLMSKGYGYRNGLGQIYALFVGNLRWCWNNGRVTGGSFWITVDRCCWWYYEGVIHQQNLGCFQGCTFVQKHRRGSFVFNPPYPPTSTRVQPWFTLGGNGNGTVRVWESGG